MDAHDDHDHARDGVRYDELQHDDLHDDVQHRGFA